MTYSVIDHGVGSLKISSSCSSFSVSTRQPQMMADIMEETALAVESKQML